MSYSDANPFPSEIINCIPVHFDKELAAGLCPELARVHDSARAFVTTIDGKFPISLAIVTEAALFNSLFESQCNKQGLGATDIAEDALILYLPADFEGVAASLVSERPDFMNCPQLNLKNNQTYISWSTAAEDKLSCTTIKVLATSLINAINRASGYSSDNDLTWIPVVMISGDVVVVGGFVWDNLMAMAFNATYLNAQSLAAQEIYSVEELKSAEEAAAVHGNKPWKHEIWKTADEWLLEPLVLVANIH